jgi:hypothetical protein
VLDVVDVFIPNTGCTGPFSANAVISGEVFITYTVVSRTL